jgi:hypothetical protein
MISLSNLLGNPLGVPGKFYPLLGLYHLLPLHFPITTWGYDVPWGRFSTPSILNLNGQYSIGSALVTTGYDDPDVDR